MPLDGNVDFQTCPFELTRTHAGPPALIREGDVSRRKERGWKWSGGNWKRMEEENREFGAGEGMGHDEVKGATSGPTVIWCLNPALPKRCT